MSFTVIVEVGVKYNGVKFTINEKIITLRDGSIQATGIVRPLLLKHRSDSIP